MTKNEPAGRRRKPAPPKAVPPDHGGGEPDSAFDVWLNRGLHQLYDDVAREPIPDELLRIIEADRTKPPPGDKDGEG